MGKKNHTLSLRSKSDLNPSAQTAGLCGLGFTTEQENQLIYIGNIINDNKNNAFGAVTELLFLYGLRISEALSVCGSDVKSDGSIRIKTLKGGSVRIVFPVVCVDFWLGFRFNRFPIVNVFSRFYFYREFKKLGLMAHFGNNDKFSTTHYLRHLKVLSMRNSGYSDIEISKFLGHNSFKSLDFYVKHERS